MNYNQSLKLAKYLSTNIDKPGHDFTKSIEDQKTEAILSCSWSRASFLRDKQRQILTIGVLKSVTNNSFKRGKF